MKRDEIEKVILNWLKSGNENLTYVAEKILELETSKPPQSAEELEDWQIYAVIGAVRNYLDKKLTRETFEKCLQTYFSDYANQQKENESI